MDHILYWNAVALEAGRRDHSQGYANGQQSGPTNTSRALAIIHLAIHDAVAYGPSSTPAGTAQAAYLFKKTGFLAGPFPVGAKLETIIAGAAYTACLAMYPRFEQFFDDALIINTAAPGFAFGVGIANELLTVRGGDGWNAAPPPAPAPTYGSHRADPYTPGQGLLGAHWGNVARFVDTPHGPGAHVPLAAFPGAGAANYLGDPDYKADYDEVRDFGAKPRLGNRTAEQERIGVYWGYDGAQGLGVPPRLYNQIARRIVTEGPTLSLGRVAELFAVINVAMADSGIDAWHYKFLHNLWRPVVGVRAEAAPHGDPFWAPLGAPQTNLAVGRPRTPPFPAYPSGHATFGAATFQALRRTLLKGAPITLAEVIAVETGGVPPIASETFTFVSDELDGLAGDPDGSVRQKVEQQIDSYARAVWENSVSRIYLGVHWRFDGIPRDAADNIGGVPLGLEIGNHVHDFFAAGASLG